MVAICEQTGTSKVSARSLDQETRWDVGRHVVQAAFRKYCGQFDARSLPTRVTTSPVRRHPCLRRSLYSALMAAVGALCGRTSGTDACLHRWEARASRSSTSLWSSDASRKDRDDSGSESTAPEETARALQTRASTSEQPTEPDSSSAHCQDTRTGSARGHFAQDQA